MRRETYIGDGIYASFDGWQIGLRAEHEDDVDVIYLEPDVLKTFIDYCNKTRRT